FRHGFRIIRRRVWADQSGMRGAVVDLRDWIWAVMTSGTWGVQRLSVSKVTCTMAVPAIWLQLARSRTLADWPGEIESVGISVVVQPQLLREVVMRAGRLEVLRTMKVCSQAFARSAG